MDTNTINELNRRMKPEYNARLKQEWRDEMRGRYGEDFTPYYEWRFQRHKKGVKNLNQTNSCAVCDKRAERKQRVVAWTIRCVGATASAAFHVALTVGVVLALTEGVVF